MRIAQISPLDECVPPLRYGGTERVVHYLTEELVRRGHEVVLFASGDSTTSAELYPCVPQALRQAGYEGDRSVPALIQLDCVAEQRHRFDVLHFHTGHGHYPLTARLDVPHLTTMHGPLSAPSMTALHHHFARVPLVSISESQRLPLPLAHWLGTIHHGLPTDLYRFEPTPSPYLAFVGRISPEKRLDRAIAIAAAAGLPLKVAAKVDAVDRAYFHAVIEPLLEGHPEVEFIGEVDDAGKQELLGHALALLFPIDWPEPFGLVMIEANACGTPVIAWCNGSTPEVIVDGLNGRLVQSIEQAVAAVRSIDQLPRTLIRADFERRFCVERQAIAYEALYRRLIEAQGDPPAPSPAQAEQPLSPEGTALAQVCHAA
ncbi:glycosyltransferase family 4 protein [Cyanobium sp. Morenito 9A2]|uniref:glycosyltransferase family 4 protein n=1 Tax=Cyanobium sp. Morenito 9A2 TaxID=2823718 RepID=UPI0020CE2538|nr:glycosyltransferase family 4 protein [Cyanobium sp. Morenito 9A2]MCP9848624.1 glycosyltransferase family 4 protein [Cyanobium sp. Morenito 9A2]